MIVPFKKAFLAVAVIAASSAVVAQSTVADLVLPPPPVATAKAASTGKSGVIGAEQVGASSLSGDERKAASPEKLKAKPRKLAKEFVPKEPVTAAERAADFRANGYHLVELPTDELAQDPVVKVQKSTAVRAVATKTEQAVDPFNGLNATPVSDSQFNRFTFPEAVLGVYFPEGAPLADCPENMKPQDACGPIFLNGRRVMLLQLLAGAKGPVQMVVHLHSGRVIDLNLMPVKGPGAVVRVDGAEDGVSDARRTEMAKVGPSAPGPANEANVALLSRFARGDVPGGFAPEALGAATRYQNYDLIPMAKWGDGSAYKVHMMQVAAHSGREVQIDVSMFRSDKVKAVALDRNTIRTNQPATVYMLEHVGE